MSRIVVGYDGSSWSEPALRWAAGEARLRGAALEIVCGWQLPLAVGPLYFQAETDLRKATEEIATEAAERVHAEHPDVTVRTVVTDESPGPALVNLARGAELLVVGSHGHGAFTGLLLGSVSLHCVVHSPCPVVVVRPSEEEAS